jgi:hypothetical protein
MMATPLVDLMADFAARLMRITLSPKASGVITSVGQRATIR